MIKKNTGDLLAVPRGIMVQGCNTLGVMGAGLAKAVKLKYPEVYAEYRRVYLSEGLTLGQVIVVPVEHAGLAEPQKFMANAMTQDKLAAKHGDVVVSYEAIETAFKTIKELALAKKLPVHVPLIGCGLAGGTWSKVGPIIDEVLGPDIEKFLWIQ